MDFKNALLIFYIIMIAPYFESLFSCDLQRLFTNSLLAKHALAFISAFFLITLVEGKDSASSVWDLLRTTLYIYVLYILSTKSKAMFVVPMLVVLFVDQILRVHAEVMGKDAARHGVNNDSDLQARALEQQSRIQRARQWLTAVIVALILAGVLHYYVRARMEYGKEFNHVLFFVGKRTCANGPVRRFME